MCVLISEMVNFGGNLSGTVRIETFCQTHGIQVSSPMTSHLCALGRIEEATEEALAKIEAAKAGCG